MLVPHTIPVNSTVKRVVRVQEHSKRGLLKEIGIQVNLDKPKTVSIGIQAGSLSLQLQKDYPIPQVVMKIVMEGCLFASIVRQLHSIRLKNHRYQDNENTEIN